MKNEGTRDGKKERESQRERERKKEADGEYWRSQPPATVFDN